MYRLSLQQSIDPNNINIALLNNEESNFIKNVEINRKTDQYANNVIAGTGDSITTYPTSFGYLNVTNNNFDILLTNEAKSFDNEYYPLWYIHRTRDIYYDKTLEIRSSTRYITSDNPVIGNLIAENTDAIIVKDSIEVTISSTSRLLTSSEFEINYTDNEIVITNAAVYENFEKFLVSYYIVTPKIVITSKGQPISESHYRIEVAFAHGEQQTLMPTNITARYMFNCSVLTNLQNSTDASYNVVYTKWNGSGVESITEILKAYPLFSRKTTAQVLEREYYLDTVNERIKVPNTSTRINYYLKNNMDGNDKIAVYAEDLNVSKPWYLRISPQSIENNSNIYTILEKNKYTYYNDVYRVVTPFNELAYVVDKKKIKLKHGNLFVTTDLNKIVTNIDITINGQSYDASNILDYDKDNGILVVSTQLNPKDTVYASYSYLTKTIIYDDLQLNPSNRFSSTNEDRILIKNYIVFVLPEEVLNPIYNRSIFHYTVEKYNSIYISYPDEQLDIDAAIAYLTGVDSETGYSNLYNVIDSKYFNDSTYDSIDVMVLCYAAAVNTSVASSVEDLDIRIRGGGVTEKITIEEILSLESDISNNLDIVQIDGERYPSNNVYYLRIPNSYVETLKTRLLKYDADLLRASRILSETDLDNSARKRAKDRIEQATKRFLPASAYRVIEYIQD